MSKRVKKLISTVLTLSIMFTLAACSSNSKDEIDSPFETMKNDFRRDDDDDDDGRPGNEKPPKPTGDGTLVTDAEGNEVTPTPGDGITGGTPTPVGPTPTHKPTSTPTCTPTSTPAPTATSTPSPKPTSTNTPAPSATNTPAPSATNTPVPTATNTPEPTVPPTEPPTSTPTEEITITVEPTVPTNYEYASKEVASSVSNEDSITLIYTSDAGFVDLVKTYYSTEVCDHDYGEEAPEDFESGIEIVLFSDDAALAAAISSDSPDMVVAGRDLTKNLIDSDSALPINDLGISYNELDAIEMYEFNKRYSANTEGYICGLTWQLNASGVFYNRDLAITYFGTDDPSEVAKKFASWDAVQTAAADVLIDSEGEVHLVAGYDDLWEAFYGSRTDGWFITDENGNVKFNIDPAYDTYLNNSKMFYDNGWSIGTTEYSEDWWASLEDGKVLSYWGDMSLVESQLSGINWGFVPAPNSYYAGGTCMIAMNGCNSKETVAEIMRAIALDSTNLEAMARTGIFVNSKIVMQIIEEDDTFGISWLGNQNPASELIACADVFEMNLDGNGKTVESGSDSEINAIAKEVANDYAMGSYDSVSAAKEDLIKLLTSATLIDSSMVE